MRSRVLRSIVFFAVASTCACSLLVTIPDDVTGGDKSSSDPDAKNLDGRDGATSPDDSSMSGDSSAPDADANAAWPVIGCSGAADTNLIAYYAFDDGAGTTVKDCSGHGHDGTISGTPAWTTGKHGGALSFNGTDNCVDLGTSADLRLTTFTIAAWVDVADYLVAGLGGHVVSKSTGNPNAIGWRLSTLDTPSNVFELKLAIEAGTPFTLATPGPQALDSWIHLGLVLVPGQRADVYVNGARVANNGTPPAIYEEVAASMRLGCNAGTKDYFKGMLDEVRIYTRALSNAEMAALAR